METSLELQELEKKGLSNPLKPDWILFKYILSAAVAFVLPVGGSCFVAIAGFMKRESSKIKIYGNKEVTTYTKDRRFKTGQRPETSVQRVVIHEYYDERYHNRNKRNATGYFVIAIIALAYYVYLFFIK